MSQYDKQQQAQYANQLAGAAGLTGGSLGAITARVNYPAPPSRGLKQEAQEVLGLATRAESLLDSLRVRLFGVYPSSNNECSEACKEPALSEILERATLKLTNICNQADLLLSKSE